MSSRDNYTHTWRDRPELAKSADHLRALGDSGHVSRLNVVDFFARTLVPALAEKLTVDLCLHRHSLDSRHLAEVEYERSFSGKPAAILHILRNVWEQARAGDPYSRFVVAHEFGHLVLHDHGVRSFSNDRALQIGFARDENSVEWQANTWASHFLLPDRFILNQAAVSRLDLAEVLSDLHQMLPQEVTSRIALLHKKLRKPDPVYVGDACQQCANFTLAPEGTILRCHTCGVSYGR